MSGRSYNWVTRNQRRLNGVSPASDFLLYLLEFCLLHYIYNGPSNRCVERYTRRPLAGPRYFGDHHAADTHLITKRYYYYENEYRTKVHKNKNTHTMNVLGLIGTHKLYHKINVFTVKTL